MKHMTLIVGIIISSTFLFPTASQNVTSQIPEQLVQQLIKDINTNKNNFHLSDGDLTVLRKNLRYELHDLNRDSKPEFFLYIDHSDWCGAGGNCSYWIYQKEDGGYKLLLEDKELRVMRSLTKGYRDLVSRVPMGFCAVNVQRVWTSFYKYNGKSYQLSMCGDGCIPIKKSR
jgi:hypothetical protein